MALRPGDHAERVLTDPLPAGAEALAAVPTAVTSDLLSALKLTPHHVEGLLPVEADGPVRMAGRAITIRFRDTRDATAAGDTRYGPLEILDRAEAGDVIVSATGGARMSFWGDNMVDVALARGVSGAVVDGCVRDRVAIRERGLPIFHQGFSPRSSMDDYVAVAYNEPISLGGLTVAAGDLVLGDEDGVIVVPRASVGVVAELIERFEQLEEQLATAMAAGEPPGSVYTRIHALKAEAIARVRGD